MNTSKLVELLSERASNYIHAFRSGGGLRVLRFEYGPIDKSGDNWLFKNNELRGYGEAPQFDDALNILVDDVENGPFKYEDVYGAGKKYPHYLTGTTEVSSNIDKWLLCGRSFDIRNTKMGGDEWRFESKATMSVTKDLWKTLGCGESITRDGITYLMETSVFGNGVSKSLKVIRNDSGLDPYRREVKVEYRAKTFEDLFKTVNEKLEWWAQYEKYDN